MSEGLKRILFIAFFVVFTIAVGIGIYYYFFRQVEEIQPPTALTEGITGEFPGAGEAVPGAPTEFVPPGELPVAQIIPGVTPTAAPSVGATTIIRDAVTQQVNASPDGSGARFYDPIEAKFYRATADGGTVELSPETFPDVETVSWGKASDQAIIQFPDGSKVHYDFTTERQTTLPKHWEEFDFSTDDQSVVTKNKAITPDSRYLLMTDPDGSNPRAIEALGKNEGRVFPHWTPNNQIIAYATVGDAQGFDRQEIILVGQNHENFRGLLVEGRGFTPLWSPSGQSVLYSVWSTRSDMKPELWISGGSPENLNMNRTELGLQTWADKCAWADEYIIYCGVPKILVRGAGVQRELFTNTDDVIYKIDIRNGATTPIGEPDGDLTITNPVISDNGANLIFMDAQSGGLYRFRLR